jgi:hypothetical protein
MILKTSFYGDVMDELLEREKLKEVAFEIIRAVENYEWSDKIPCWLKGVGLVWYDEYEYDYEYMTIHLVVHHGLTPYPNSDWQDIACDLNAPDLNRIRSHYLPEGFSIDWGYDVQYLPQFELLWGET